MEFSKKQLAAKISIAIRQTIIHFDRFEMGDFGI
jgi:hypothetical protein